MRQCRIAITTACNLQCSYCCMKYPEVIKTFKPIDFLSDIDLSSYDSFAITGGEPLLYSSRAIMISAYVKTPTNKVFLYTNGLLLKEKFLKDAKNYIDGINIGLHDPIVFDYVVGLHKLPEMHKIMPTRILIWEKLLTDDLKKFFDSNQIPYRAWVMDECENLDEDRYILK